MGLGIPFSLATLKNGHPFIVC